MWVSAALLPCCEVAAAMSVHEQAAHSDCGHPGTPLPDPQDGNKHAPCFSIAVPAQVSFDRVGAASGNPVLLVSIDAAAFRVLPPPPERSLRIKHRTAPAPVAVYLRSLRLLI
jgi:hypothetical protein